MSSTLLIERQGAVETWTMNDPATRNALSDAVVDSLLQACGRAAQDATLRIVVLTGAGGAFCAGGSLGGFASLIGQPLQDGQTDPLLAMYDEPFAGLDPISLNVIAELIRKLNDALGTTSIVVTYDVSESLKLVDYIYVISDGVLAGEGTPAELLASEDPFLKQFLHALPDGPVRFHAPARPMAEDLRLAKA